MLRKKRPPNAPKFMIVGAQKAGTTALYEYLSKHPHIIGSIPKELHYFSCDKRFSKGEDYYHSLFPLTANPDDITFDASPSYLHNKSAYKRINDYNPQIKIIVLLRDPVERAYSAWNMYMERYEKNRNWFFDEWVSFCGASGCRYRKRNEDTLFNFKDYIVEERECITNDPFALLESPVLSHGLYHIQLSRYLSLFDSEQILIIENTDLRNKLILTLRRVENFLRIKSHLWDDENLNPVFEGVYNQGMDDEAREILSDFYADHNEMLFEVMGCRFGWNH